MNDCNSSDSDKEWANYVVQGIKQQVTENGQLNKKSIAINDNNRNNCNNDNNKKN